MRAARVLRPYTVVGEEMLGAKRPAKLGVICLTHVITLSMSRVEYLDVLRDFPTMSKTMRHNVLRDTVREGVRHEHYRGQL
jgi:hypothetical protein